MEWWEWILYGGSAWLAMRCLTALMAIHAARLRWILEREIEQKLREAQQAPLTIAPSELGPDAQKEQKPKAA